MLCFSSGDFKSIERRTTRGTTLSIWTIGDEAATPAAANFVAHFAPTIFDRVEKDVAVNYALAKLDLVLAPSYPLEGLQHLGLIVLRASALHFESGAGDVTREGRANLSCNVREICKYF